MRLSGFLSASVFAAMMLSCTNVQEKEIIPTGLTTDTQELLFSEASDTKSIVVVSGSRWRVDEMPSWLSVHSIDSRRYSEYEWTVNLASEANAGYDREGMLTIHAGSDAVNIPVEQDGQKGKYVAVESVSISPSVLTLTEGETKTLTASILPSNASEKGVSWSSSNTSVATVTSSGVVTAKAAGSATITVKTNDGAKTATCSVTVKAATVSVTGVSLDKTSLSMTVGDTQTLTATVTPSNATDKSVTWKSSNTAVSTVSSSGVVTAKAAGTATITVTTNDGAKTATCSVTVQAAKVSVTGVSLNKSSLSMTVGDTETLTATVLPSNATDKSVTWSSSNTSVATVSSSGVVTAKTAGSAMITVKTNDGAKTATCSVNVVDSSGYDYVDLGLPSGLKWATCNLGASSPEEYGDYYAWGETTTKSNYSWSTYKWCSGSSNTLTKYNTKSSYGVVDNKTELEPEDDAAHVNLGGKWRIPTYAEWIELIENCTWTWTKQNGVLGSLFTSNVNGNSIFLPAAGDRGGTNIYDAGSYGYYWSSSLNEGDSDHARLVFFSSGDVYWGYTDRCVGFSVRPVTE